MDLDQGLISGPPAAFTHTKPSSSGRIYSPQTSRLPAESYDLILEIAGPISDLIRPIVIGNNWRTDAARFWTSSQLSLRIPIHGLKLSDN